MEPRRHHYLPQFLLRGFASRSKGNDFYAWVFRAGDVPPFEANLKNLAQQRDFHGNPKDSPLENIISSHENKFAPVIEQLRLGIVEEAALPTIREFVAHLMIRTKNIRAGFAEAAQGFLEEFGESIPTSDRKKWKNRMKKAARKEWRDPKMRELLAHLPKDKRVLFKRMFEKKILETDFRPIVSVLFNSLLQNVNLDAAASTGHISALTREPAPPATDRQHLSSLLAVRGAWPPLVHSRGCRSLREVSGRRHVSELSKCPRSNRNRRGSHFPLGLSVWDDRQRSETATAERS